MVIKIRGLCSTQMFTGMINFLLNGLFFMLETRKLLLAVIYILTVHDTIVWWCDENIQSAKNLVKYMQTINQFIHL